MDRLLIGGKAKIAIYDKNVFISKYFSITNFYIYSGISVFRITCLQKFSRYYWKDNLSIFCHILLINKGSDFILIIMFYFREFIYLFDSSQIGLDFISLIIRFLFPLIYNDLQKGIKWAIYRSITIKKFSQPKYEFLKRKWLLKIKQKKK